MAPPRSGGRSTPAEISTVQLRNCLVNLPAPLQSLLQNVNTPAQNVVVEICFRAPPSNGETSGAAQTRSVFVGWTGMPSKRKVAPIVSRDGISKGNREQDVSLVEMDSVLASTLGLSDGQKVTATLHVDPPLVHTINIEPLTPEDWEVIELHANFLELNMQSQIRAIANPNFTPNGGSLVPPHPLTVHLSPTTTANMKIISIEPVPPADVAFAKVAPDAEMIVAPKTRKSVSRGDSKSVASTKSRRSGTSTVKRHRDEPRPVVYLRGMDRMACSQWFDDDHVSTDLSIWADKDVLVKSGFQGVNYALVDLMRPGGIAKAKLDDSPGPRPASRLVAKLRIWEDGPNGQAVALSSPLCAAFGSPGMVGGIVKMQPAPQQLPRSAIRHIKVYPFVASMKEGEGLKFGGETKAEKEESAKRFRAMYWPSTGSEGLLRGPVTDCTLFGTFPGLEGSQGWEGGLIKFDYDGPEPKEGSAKWVVSLDNKVPIQFQPPVPRPAMIRSEDPWDMVPTPEGALAGVDDVADRLFTQLRHMSSTLVAGAMGSGKTGLVKLVAERLRQDELYHTTYFPCSSMVNDESRTSAIKETLDQVFMAASWRARLGGRALVILDDLDKLCPAETELVVGNDNERSKLVSETLLTITRQYCSRDGGVVLLAVAKGKDALHKALVGGHMVRETVELAAPGKEARKQILDLIVGQCISTEPTDEATSTDGSRPATADGSTSSDHDHGGDWMDGGVSPTKGNARPKADGFMTDPSLDLLDVAGSVDGYMPADLAVLVARARTEAMFRAINTASAGRDAPFVLGPEDFSKALQDFTPATLRNVTLQKSTTTFGSIGGLKETRRVLLETLEYPTKYAPLFAKCPLRLRSGLLLYGYPGCGKTLLASAVAGECGLNFISVKGPEILNKYIGASEKSVRDLFERAQSARPCVLFFDEFDSVAPKRGHDSTGVTDRVVNQLLTQMDGAEGLEGVYVLAATSRPDLIDPALLRPGRLDKALLCDLPSQEDRADILAALLGKVRLEEGLVLEELGEELLALAGCMAGFSGADLQALVSNAQLEAIHEVLRDQDGDRRPTTTANGSGAGTGAGAGGRRAGTPSFVQFPFGAPESTGTMTGSSKRGRSGAETTRAAELAENARILAKLEALRVARRKAKEQNRARLSDGLSSSAGRETTTTSGPDGGKDAASKEVVVRWEHLVRALEGTRRSISNEERARLGRIYREFVGARSGELRDGQGGFEIGGRSSLM